MKRIIYKSIIYLFLLNSLNSLMAQDQDSWTTFTTVDGLANNNVSTIIEASDGALWFGTSGGGVSRYHAGN